MINSAIVQSSRFVNLTLALAVAVLVTMTVQRIANSVPPSGLAAQTNELDKSPVGSRLERLGEVDFSATSKTLVLLVSSSCQYCMDDADFYRALSREVSSAPGTIQFVVVGTEPAETLTGFVRRNFLTPHRIVSVKQSEVQARIVPTILLVDRAGRIQHVWTGEQSKAGEMSILKMIRHAETLN